MAPNQLLYRRYWNRVREEWRRRKPGVSAQWSLYAGPRMSRSWIDYHLRTVGTVPEKILFNEFDRRGIDFYFSFNFGDIPFTSDREAYRPDFVIPSANLIVEVWGVYWHTLPGHFEMDRLRNYLLIAAGWKVVTILDTDIVTDVDAAISKVPELRNLVGGGRSYVASHPDPTAAARARIRAWPKAIVPRFKTAGRRKGSVVKSHFPSARAATPWPVTPGSLWTSAAVDPELAEEFRKYGQEWKQYITQLGKYFKNVRARATYPREYAYYLRWKDWWTRFGRD